MTPTTWCRALLGTCFLALTTLTAIPSVAQEPPDRGRAATEAASQATEADRQFKLGEFAAALPLYEAERASRATTGDLRYEAYALRAIGICRAELGDDAAAIVAWKQAFTLDLKRDDPGFAGYDGFLIAQAEARLDRPEAALITLELALPRLNGAADRDHEIDALLVLTRVAVSIGRAERVRSEVARALDLAQKSNDPWRIGDSWASQGQVNVATGRAAAALEDFSNALKVFDQQGRAADIAWIESLSASTLVLLNRPDEALTRYQQAARSHQHLEDGGSAAEDLTAIAGLHLEAGRLDPALTAAREAVDQARDADDRPREIDARVRLAQVQGARHDWPTAAETLDEAVILGRQIYRDDPVEQVRILLTAAATDAKASLTKRVEERLKIATFLADESGLTELKQTVATIAVLLQAPKPPPLPSFPR